MALTPCSRLNAFIRSSVFFLTLLVFGSSVANAFNVKMRALNDGGHVLREVMKQNITRRADGEMDSVFTASFSNGNVDLAFTQITCSSAGSGYDCISSASTSIRAVLDQFISKCSSDCQYDGYEYCYSATDSSWGNGIYAALPFRIEDYTVLNSFIEDANLSYDDGEIINIADQIANALYDINEIMVCVQLMESNDSFGTAAIVLSWNWADYGFYSGQIDTILDSCAGAFD